MRLLKSNLSQIGELSLLKKLCCKLPLRKDVVIGAGDDCAVVKIAGDKKYDYLLKSDGVVEGVHFKPDTQPELIGHKALGRVFSDFAAMGGEPLWILVDLVAPPKMPVKRIEKIYSGMTSLANDFSAAIVGGDVSSGKELQLHVFGVGRVEKGMAILRSGAKPGDAIFVTGELGGSIAGKHLNFTPRLHEGQWLSRKRFSSAMIDISDGLLRDLGHIMRSSGAGARLMLDSIPLSASAAGTALAHGRLRKALKIKSGTLPFGKLKVLSRVEGQAAALQNKRNGLLYALTDGEDYELLFTVSRQKTRTFLKAWEETFRRPCFRIGWMTERKGKLEGIDSKGKAMKLNDAGFEHFSSTLNLQNIEEKQETGIFTTEDTKARRSRQADLPVAENQEEIFSSR